MKRYIRSNSRPSNITADSVQAGLKELVESGQIPAHDSVIKTSDRYSGTTYWRVNWLVDDDTILEYIEEYPDYSLDDIVEKVAYNAIFLEELPEDDFGGMALGDITSWKPSSIEEAEADDYGQVD